MICIVVEAYGNRFSAFVDFSGSVNNGHAKWRWRWCWSASNVCNSESIIIQRESALVMPSPNLLAEIP